jgi:hypothetical protein
MKSKWAAGRRVRASIRAVESRAEDLQWRRWSRVEEGAASRRGGGRAPARASRMRQLGKHQGQGARTGGGGGVDRGRRHQGQDVSGRRGRAAFSRGRALARKLSDL